MSAWMALVFIVIGGLLTWVGALINHVMEQRREASREELRTKEKLRQDVLKIYIEDGTAALQKDLAYGLGAVVHMEQLLLRMRLMDDQQLQDSKALLAETSSIDFRSDPYAEFVGLARVTAFGKVFAEWVLCGYRSIALYLTVAHNAVAKVQMLLAANVKLTEEKWEEIAGHLFVNGKLWELTVGTVDAVIRDLDIVATIARELDYHSFADPVLRAADAPEFKALRELIEPEVADFKKKEEEGLGKEAEKSD